MYLYADVCGGVAAGLWRATARAAANGMKPAKAAVNRRRGEARMATRNGHEDKERNEATVTEHFAAKAHETVETLAERAQRAEREVRAAAQRTAEQARQLRDEYADTAEQGLRRASSYVESNPLAVVAVAFLAGVLLSAMIRR
jgi:ElaB/YqjD/DUF883 family membrane-anchored ribosome-binding protein